MYLGLFRIYEEIVDSYFLHYNVKSRVSLTSSENKINLNREGGSIFVNNDNSFLTAKFAWLKEPLIC